MRNGDALNGTRRIERLFGFAGYPPRPFIGRKVLGEIKIAWTSVRPSEYAQQLEGKAFCRVIKGDDWVDAPAVAQLMEIFGSNWTVEYVVVEERVTDNRPIVRSDKTRRDRNDDGRGGYLRY